MHNTKIPVAVLGATGSVGQKFIQLLADHPWFEIAFLGASERSAGKSYKDAVNWFMTSPIPDHVAEMTVQSCEPNFEGKIVFSGLDASVAGEIEENFARAGYIVISNSKNHRYDPDVPLLIPEVNSDHLALIERQNYGEGMIVTNPNCSTVALSLALKPLHDAFTVESVHVVTLQALSGAGYPGVSSLDVIDNVIPFIGGEEEKMEKEPLKIFGRYENGKIEPSTIRVSAQCNRVPVVDGHMECVSVKLKKQTSCDEIISVWNNFSAEPQALDLPFAPKRPIHYFADDRFPQPKLHRNLEGGMALSVGRLQECPLFDFKFVLLGHNTIRGAAGGAILNAELMIKKNLITV